MRQIVLQKSSESENSPHGASASNMMNDLDEVFSFHLKTPGIGGFHSPASGATLHES